MKHSRQSGNALWLILVAIVLIGALTAMFTRSTSTSDDTGDAEQVSIQASEVLRYANAVETGIQNLLSRGCSENELSFWNDSNGDGIENSSDDYYNAGSPPDHSCHLFDPAGAGLVHQEIGKKISDSLTTIYATANIGRVIKDVGSDAHTDLYLQIGNSRAAMEPFCDEVNRRAGIIKTGTAGAVYDPANTLISGMASVLYTGSFFSPITNVYDYSAWRGDAKYFCYGHNTSTNYFVYVLLAR